MADREVDFLLIGGGMAAAHCATTLRRRGAAGSVLLVAGGGVVPAAPGERTLGPRGAGGWILLVGREPHVPYERPPLSKEYMRGESSEEDTYVEGADWYEENAVELLTETNVLSLGTGTRTAKLQSREEVRFGKAL